MKHSLRMIRKDYHLYLLFLPVILYYAVFRYLPMVNALVIPFKNYDVFKGLIDSPWVGLENFRQFFASVYFWRILRNTLSINFLSIAIVFPAPIVFALLLNEIRRDTWKRIVQTISYLPHFISTVVVVSMIVTFLSPSMGMINHFIEMLGFERIHFLLQPKYFRTIYISMVLWQSTGFASIIYLASLTGINPELYEAAHIDGAGRWRQTWHITIPGISSTIIVMLIMRLGQMLEVGYEAIILLYNPSIYETADVISSYVYRRGILDANYSFAGAVGLFQSLLGLLLVVGANRVARKWSETSLW